MRLYKITPAPDGDPGVEVCDDGEHVVTSIQDWLWSDKELGDKFTVELIEMPEAEFAGLKEI